MKSNIQYKNGIKIIDKNNEKYVYKIRKEDKTLLYKYLKSKEFNHYLSPLETTIEHEIYKYIDNEPFPIEDKAIDIVHIMSLLHAKTTSYQEINIDKVKELYEETKKTITYLRTYYLDIQDYFESKIYMSPAAQLLMNNISKFHKSLAFAEEKLDSWYQEKSKLKKERLVQLHNNLAIEHLLKGENTYLISWNKSKKDLVIFDFLKFYKNEFQNLEMVSLFEIYQNKYKYTSEEFLLFQALISIPEKLTFKKTNYINTLEVRKQVDYIDKTNEFLSKYYEKNQEANDKEFKQ